MLWPRFIPSSLPWGTPITQGGLQSSCVTRWHSKTSIQMCSQNSWLGTSQNSWLGTSQTTHALFAFAIDQAYKQNKASVKCDGGAVGLTENPAALSAGWYPVQRWQEWLQRSKPQQRREQRRLISGTMNRQSIHSWRLLEMWSRSISGVMREMGNPFCDDSTDLLVLYSRDMTDPAVINTVRQIEKLGQEQYHTYVSERLVNQTKPITDPIRRNNLPLFSRSPVREKSSLKNDCSILSRLFIASQMRDGNLDDFFAHENQPCLPALSRMGKMRLGKKVWPRGIILDGAVITNMLAPGGAKTCSDYATHGFLPYVTFQLQHAIRVDVVWDECLPDSLKTDTRTKRGRGIRRRVEASSSIPGNCQAFLRIDENKVELFSFLATRLAARETEKQVISTLHKDVVCTHDRYIAGLAPCTHEEADTRMLLHVEDAMKQGYTKLSIHTFDTDAVVLVVAAAERLSIDALWVAFGTGNSFRFLAAREMAQALGHLVSVESYPYFMLSVGVIPYQALEAGAKRLHGRRGRYVMRSLRPSVP